jgi:hypothetical protein
VSDTIQAPVHRRRQYPAAPFDADLRNEIVLYFPATIAQGSSHWGALVSPVIIGASFSTTAPPPLQRVVHENMLFTNLVVPETSLPLANWLFRPMEPPESRHVLADDAIATHFARFLDWMMTATAATAGSITIRPHPGTFAMARAAPTLEITKTPAALRVERLSAIQAALALPWQELAEVLRISRPNLYKWLDASKDITVQADNRQRLAAIERVSKLWREQTGAPLSAVIHEPLASGLTALQMLKADEIDEAALGRAFKELVGRLHQRPKTRSQRRAEAGFKRRPSARALPREE